jgi:hypothetical protein
MEDVGWWVVNLGRLLVVSAQILDIFVRVKQVCFVRNSTRLLATNKVKPVSKIQVFSAYFIYGSAFA